MRKIKLAPWQFTIVCALAIVVLNNNSLASSLLHSPEILSLEGFAFCVSLFLLMTLIVTGLFFVSGNGRIQAGVIAVFFIATSILGYFTNELGVIFDKEMMLNILETVRENNSAEAMELASVPFITHVFLVGVLPLALFRLVEVKTSRPLKEVFSRVLVVFVGLILLAATLIPNYRFTAYYSREHKKLEYVVLPIYPLISLYRIASSRLIPKKPFMVLDKSAYRKTINAKHTIGIMVVGETARAKNFSLNKYKKLTNPNLQKMANVQFFEADSCGTSTLYSVPCMFSMRNRKSYDSNTAGSESNVLDILAAAGVKPIWIDNNSSCKGVCTRIENVNLLDSSDDASEYYSDSGYFDEILIEKVEEYLDGQNDDVLLILHMIGSHGPAYSKRYPEKFAVFEPYCDKLSPTECTTEEVENAYDNTIVYTDHILSTLINKLAERENDFNSFVFYASDHGESLGENGVYLHGLPYAIAPKSQTNVPIIFWASKELIIDRSSEHVRASNTIRLSHDNISHTLLGLYHVEATLYQQDLDFLSNKKLLAAK